MVLAAISEPMDEPRVSMEIENHRLVYGEKGVKIAVRQPVRVVLCWLQLEQIHDVDVSNLQVGKFLAKKHDRRQRFLRRNVARRGHDQVRLASLIVASLLPHTDSLRTMNDGFLHVHVLKV